MDRSVAGYQRRARRLKRDELENQVAGLKRSIEEVELWYRLAGKDPWRDPEYQLMKSVLAVQNNIMLERAVAIAGEVQCRAAG